jgi:recombination protein RecA
MLAKSAPALAPPMKEEHRQRAIRLKLVRMENSPAGPAIATGFHPLDSTLGGGFPRGGIVELFGPSSSGKTTLALQVIARLQRNGFTAGWIDAEHSFDPAYAASLGVVIERLAVAQPDSAEQALEIARQLAVSGAVDLLVIDSAAALVPKLELETGIGESGHGLHSRVLASGLRSLSSTMARTGTALVFLNQVRTRMDSSGGEAETSAGGAPLKLHAAVRIALGPCTGKRVRFRVLKNKVAAAFGEGELEWNQDLGFVETP